MKQGYSSEVNRSYTKFVVVLKNLFCTGSSDPTTDFQSYMALWKSISNTSTNSQPMSSSLSLIRNWSRPRTKDHPMKRCKGIVQVPSALLSSLPVYVDSTWHVLWSLRVSESQQPHFQCRYKHAGWETCYFPSAFQINYYQHLALLPFQREENAKYW